MISQTRKKIDIKANMSDYDEAITNDRIHMKKKDPMSHKNTTSFTLSAGSIQIYIIILQ